MQLCVFTLPDRAARFSADPETLARYAATRTGDVYLSVACHAGIAYPHGGRGTAEQVAGILGFGADIDYGTDGHQGKRYPPTEADAHALIAALPLAPTVIVHSGHGLQCWWFFQEAYIFDDATDRQTVADIMRGWNGAIQAAAAAREWTVDSVGDLARVLRLPGTWNRKREPVMPVRVLSDDGPRYAGPSGFAAYATAAPAASRPAAGPVSMGDLVLDPSRQPPRAKYDALRDNNRRFKQALQRNRPDLQDQSPSGYDQSLANSAAQAEWTDQEIVDLLISVRAEHGDDLKLDRADYYRRTIAHARAEGTGRGKCAAAARAAVREPMGGDEALALLSETFGVTVTRVTALGSEDTDWTYTLETAERGAVQLGGTDLILSCALTRARWAKATGTLLGLVKPTAWEPVAAALLALAEREELPGVAPLDELKAWLQAGLSKAFCMAHMDGYDSNGRAVWRECAESEPFADGDAGLIIRRGIVHVNAPKFVGYVRGEFARALTAGELAALLRRAGFTSKVVTALDATTQGEGMRTRRRYWTAPLSVIDAEATGQPATGQYAVDPPEEPAPAVGRPTDDAAAAHARVRADQAAYEQRDAERTAYLAALMQDGAPATADGRTHTLLDQGETTRSRTPVRVVRVEGDPLCRDLSLRSAQAITTRSLIVKNTPSDLRGGVIAETPAVAVDPPEAAEVYRNYRPAWAAKLTAA